MTQALTVLTQVGILVFVVAGMAAMGLGLSVPQIVAPLRAPRLVAAVLVANFVVVPVVAVGAARLLPMDEASAAAVILIGCAAGAPFLPTLAGLAKGDAATAVGVMVLLMVLTVGFAPVVVPRVLEGATVSPGDIASSLVVYMLVPLALGLALRARYPSFAGQAAAALQRASTTGLAVGIVAGLLVTWRDVLGSVGSWIFVGTGLVLLVGLIAGWLTGLGRPVEDRQVLALATAQRNVSAALVIAASLGSDAMVRTLVAALVVPVVLILVAGELGRRSAGTAPTLADPPGPATS
ncbi:bile acid:sodium symporter family protein [Nocardioides sp.]|uniref:bile acid:sodium symporter family protein n=1 Tax=Nocardioides sp. TaxID=35761 RepID=UPI003526EE4B